MCRVLRSGAGSGPLLVVVSHVALHGYGVKSCKLKILLSCADCVCTLLTVSWGCGCPGSAFGGLDSSAPVVGRPTCCLDLSTSQ
jgi:hypothetical protein